MRATTRGRIIAGLAAAALLTSACLNSDDGGSDGGGDDGGGGTSGAGGSDPGDGVVTISGVFTGEEQKAFEASFASFEEESGIDIQYTGNPDFATLISSQLSGNPPDMGVFPQPGLLLDLAERGDVVPIDEFLDVPALEETLIPGFLDSVTAEDGAVYGAPVKLSAKSFVFVPAKAWEEGGYPTEFASVQELMETAEQIEADGREPWCIGYQDGPNTGWVGTDWLEEMVLRVAGPEVYDQWTSHEIPFDDPQIVEALDAYRELIGEDAENVLGGPDGIVNTPFGEAGNPAFEDPPGCMMHRQGNFITGFFPKDVAANLDQEVSIFAFPGYEGGFDGQPMLGGGDTVALFNGDDQEAKDVMEFLTSDEFGAEWAGIGGYLSPHTTFDTALYPDETTRRVAEVVASSDVFRFDGSDLMPGEVGAGSFWEESVKWAQGEVMSEEMLANVEATWPE
jgi:alpha-glucoside transport system substrate-binding protein